MSPQSHSDNRIGDTLPLFEEELPVAERPKARTGGGDAHMQAAFDLARNLDRRGRRTQPRQRLQAGIAICRHMASSLRMQAEREARDRGARSSDAEANIAGKERQDRQASPGPDQH